MWGIIGVQKEALLAARRVIVTVEEIVDVLDAGPGAVLLPSWVITAIAQMQHAHASYAQDYYERDNAWSASGYRVRPRIWLGGCTRRPSSSSTSQARSARNPHDCRCRSVTARWRRLPIRS